MCTSFLKCVAAGKKRSRTTDLHYFPSIYAVKITRELHLCTLISTEQTGQPSCLGTTLAQNLRQFNGPSLQPISRTFDFIVTFNHRHIFQQTV
jgi:hypothetical protein